MIAETQHLFVERGGFYVARSDQGTTKTRVGGKGGHQSTKFGARVARGRIEKAQCSKGEEPFGGELPERK